MRINLDNIPIIQGTKYTECPILKAAVILKPSEARRYFGSYNKHMMLNIGIFKVDGYVKVIDKEYDSTTKTEWCLINYNDLYYYTPSIYINLKEFKNNNINHDTIKIVDQKKEKDNQIISRKLETSIPVEWSDGSESDNLSWIPVNNEGIFLIANKDTYSYPKPSIISEPIDNQLPKYSILKSNRFVAYQTVRASQTGFLWYVTADIDEDGESRYVLAADCVILSGTKMVKNEWVMCNKDTDITKSLYVYKDVVIGNATKGTIYNILSSYDDVMGDNYSHTKYNIIMYKDKRGHACGGMLKMKDCTLPTDNANILDVSKLGSIRLTKSMPCYILPTRDFYSIINSDILANVDLPINSTVYVVNSFDRAKYSYVIGYIQNFSTTTKDYENKYILLTFNGAVSNDYNDIPISTPDSIVDTTPHIVNSESDIVSIRSNIVDDIPLPDASYDSELTKLMQQQSDIIEDKDTTEYLNYKLSRTPNNDKRYLNKINRFNLLTDKEGIMFKGFVFVTRPDLNLFKEGFGNSNDTYVNTDQMNPDLEILPTFNYMFKLPLGRHVNSSLSYWQTMGTNLDLKTPWLSAISNSVTGYQVRDRSVDKVEMASTFHGNKVIYSEPTFAHKIANTVDLTFNIHNDLSLFYIIKTWVEYVQCVSLGKCSPRQIHINNAELDYAVSLNYIATDPTMENILYWEKLTGLIPLAVPDDIFSWTADDPINFKKEFTITFAYSMRTVQDVFHMSEINYLYNYTKNGMDGIQPNTYSADFINTNDDKINSTIVNIAKYFNKINDNTDNYLRNEEWLKKYYYKEYDTIKSNISGQPTVTGKFLPNFIPEIGMHGIPYVTGPYITYEYNKVNGITTSSGNYKLRWV